jgi:tetratricopeptide (TPR) repeat protein/GTP-binding protein EngB required for normal cell division
VDHSSAAGKCCDRDHILETSYDFVMGILDRIAGTLDELTGDAEADIAAEIDRARELAAVGDVEAAERTLADLAQRQPKSAAVARAQGGFRAGQGDLEGAALAYGRAVDLDNDSPETWQALGDTLAALGRTEPARDALRRALALGLDARLRARAYAALGRVHAHAGEWAAAARAQQKALELTDDDRLVALDYGRTLARLGAPEADEWLTRAARAEGADVHVFIEAAAATTDDALAERLLREGLARDGGDRRLRVALASRLGRAGRHDEAVALAEACVVEAPDDLVAVRAVREIYASAGRAADGLRAAEMEARLGSPPPPEARVALALATGNREALARLAAEPPGSGEIGAAVRAFVERRASETQLLALGRLAPNADARRFVARDGAPPDPPAGQLAGLLGWTHDLAASTPALATLLPGAGHALEALDRPLLVAVMGEFNAGKSSVVNALLGEEVAPTGVTPTTATVNAIRYAATPAARVIAEDGHVRDLAAADVAAFLTRLGDAEARAVRMVEVFLPVEALRQVEIVDTPGLNSIRPEHERVARDFLQEADAIVWVFAIGQAAKASEKEALAFAHGAGKRVLGVLNKVDRAEPAEVDAVMRHVSSSLGELVETIVPFSATRALAARRSGGDDPDFAALSTALNERFFRHARELKRATAVAALGRFLTAARAAARAVAPAPPAFAATRATLARLQRDLLSALAGERIALRARLDEAYRRAALEVREFVRPRAWLFGEHRATPADEDFLTDLLEDAVTRAVDRTRATLRQPFAADATPDAGVERVAPRVAAAIDAAADRFAAYAHGVIEGGAVPDFFRHQLPRLRLDHAAAIRDALARRAPDPEQALFAPLARDLDAVFRAAAAELHAAEIDAELRALFHAERLERPLAALQRALDALGANG